MHVLRENDITDVVFQTFSATGERFGETVTTDLKPDGDSIPVTEQNKKDYVTFVVHAFPICSADLQRG
jgi:E3 ubiquitin-protein ligase NEDD4